MTQSSQSDVSPRFMRKESIEKLDVPKPPGKNQNVEQAVRLRSKFRLRLVVPDRLLLFPLVLCFALSIICIQHIIREHARIHFANMSWQRDQPQYADSMFSHFSNFWLKQKMVKVEILGIDQTPAMSMHEVNGTKMYFKTPEKRRFERRVDIPISNVNMTLAEV